tara:strand:+ start:86 stop:1537 length:1452 start_codon:yes stop_codon:yes gene_type:complete
MSNLSDLLPAGAGGKQVDFVASGTIGNGVTVGLNSNGTVSAIATVQNSPPVYGAESVIFVNSGEQTAVAYDSLNNKVVVAYRDNSNSSYMTAIVGTVSGSSISFGSSYVFLSRQVSFLSMDFDATAGKVVVAYKDSQDNYGYAQVGTVSGTSISFGSQVLVSGNSSDDFSVVYDGTAGKTVVFYRGTPYNVAGEAKVGTVSGTSISFGSLATWTNNNPGYISSAYDSTSGKVVVVYADQSASSAKAIVGTVSGTSISFGSEGTLDSGLLYASDTTYDSNAQRIVVAYTDANNSNYLTTIVGTVSGTSISFGTSVVVVSSYTQNSCVDFDATANKVLIAYRDNSNNNYGTTKIGTVSGTSISLSSASVFVSGLTNWLRGVYDPDSQRIVLAYSREISSQYKFVAQTAQLASQNFTSFVGISDAAISSAASGSVTIKGGISSNVTSLTANSTYYVQDDGTLTTTTSTVLAGKALSSTSINLDYTT